MPDLQCRAGHVWTRPAQRGKPPVWCAEHRPKADANVATTGAPRKRRYSPTVDKETRAQRRAAKEAAVMADMPTTAAELAEWWSMECADPARCPEHRAEYKAQRRALAVTAA